MMIMMLIMMRIIMIMMCRLSRMMTAELEAIIEAGATTRTPNITKTEQILWVRTDRWWRMPGWSSNS